MTTGEVEITVADSGSAAIIVPAASTQLVIGCSKLPAGGAAAFQIIATQNPATLMANQGPGPLVEAGALTCVAGGTVLSMNVPKTTSGTATVPAVTQGTGGSTGTSAVTTTLDAGQGAFDDLWIQVNVLSGGTIGTGPISLQVSYDAGRNFGPPVALGTANSLVLPNTGVTLNFGAGTLVTGNIIRLSTVGPRWQISDVLAALVAFKSSPYGVIGVGSIHIVGGGSVAGYTALSASDIQALSNVVLSTGVGTGGLDLLAQAYIFDRAFASVRDAAGPQAFTGASAETQSTWSNAVSALSSVTTGVHSPRLCVHAGYYNMPSAFPTTMAGTPAYRRPASWAIAQRQVVIPPERHAGRVKDGALTAINVNPVSDPTDGFVYYDTRLDTSLDSFRFSTLRTRVGKGAAFYSANPNLMSVPGSVFTIYPLGAVMDLACDIAHQVGEDEINDDLRLNPNGTIFANDAARIELEIEAAFADQLSGKVSGYRVTVDRTVNVLATSKVKVTIGIEARGYILELDIFLNYVPAQAA